MVTILCTLALGGTAWLSPTRAAVGGAYTEAPGHLWGLWATARHIFEWGPLVRHADVGFPYAFDAHLMDPINLVVFLPFYWLAGGGATGAVLGWNALHAAAVLLGGYGCFKLSERLFGGHPALPWIGAVMAAVFCGNTYLMNWPYMGRTEALPAVIYPLHLSLLHAWMRLPVGLERRERSEAPHWKVGVYAGLSLGATALGGSYLSVFLGLAEVPIALWMGLGLPWREALYRWATVAGLAGICVAPAIWALVNFPPDHSSVLNTSRATVEVTDYPFDALPVIFRVRPHGDDGRWMDMPAYVGVISLGLGLFAAAARPRVAAIWLLVALWMLSFAPGPFLIWDSLQLARSGSDDLVRLPGYYLLTAVPQLQALRAWGRISGLTSAVAATAAGMGFAVLTLRASPRGATRLGLLFVGLALLDQGTYPKRYSPIRPWFGAHAPPELLAAVKTLSPGALLELPINIPLRVGGGPEIKGTYWLWQLEHGRPISATPKSAYDMALLDSAIARQAARFEMQSVTARGGSLDPSAKATGTLPSLGGIERDCARADALRMHEQGFAAIVLHEDRAGASELDDLLTTVLGPPTVNTPPVLAWDLAEYARDHAEGAKVDDADCVLPKLPDALRKKVEPTLRAMGGR